MAAREQDTSQDTEREDPRDFLHEGLVITEIDGEKVVLDMWDTHRRDDRGQTEIGYEMRHGDMTIFQGDGFAGSPLHADDSDKTIGALLSFLSLRKGDTDAEYFEAYSATQLEWAEQHGEELSLVVFEIEEATISCLDDMLDSEEMQQSRFGASSDDWISDPERDPRREEAAAEGLTGSTHGEHISDMRRCLREKFESLPEFVRDRIEREIDELEEWFSRQRRLDEQT